MKPEYNGSVDLGDIISLLSESSETRSKGWDRETKELFNAFRTHFKQAIHTYNVTKTPTVATAKPSIVFSTSTKANTLPTGADWGVYVAAVVSIGVTVVIIFSVFLICRDVFKRRKGRHTEDLEADVLPPTYDEVQTHPQAYEQISHISRNISSLSVVTTGSLPPPDYENLFGVELHAKPERPRSAQLSAFGDLLKPLPILRTLVDGTTEDRHNFSRLRLQLVDSHSSAPHNKVHLRCGSDLRPKAKPPDIMLRRQKSLP